MDYDDPKLMILRAKSGFDDFRNENYAKMFERSAKFEEKIYADVMAIAKRSIDVDINGLLAELPEVHVAQTENGFKAPLSSQSPFGFSDPKKLDLSPQLNGGKWIKAPPLNQIEHYLKTYPKFDMVEHMKLTTAISNGKLFVERSGKNVTLRGDFSVYAENPNIKTSTPSLEAAQSFIDDVKPRWDLSYKDGGLRYGTKFSYTPVDAKTGADIRINYFDLADHRASATVNGQINMDKRSFPTVSALDKGVPAHEFGHAIPGLPDMYAEMLTTYSDVFKPVKGEEYYLRGVVYYGEKNNLMANSKTGTISGENLKAMILKIESMQKTLTKGK